MESDQLSQAAGSSVNYVSDCTENLFSTFIALFINLLFYCFICRDMVSLCSPHWSQTHNPQAEA
jgi:hypothetical protein